MKYDSAKTIIEKWPSQSELARDLGVDRSTVCKWLISKKNGGTDGIIPQKYHRQIVHSARERGITITAGDLLCL